MKGLIALLALAFAAQVPSWDQPSFTTAPLDFKGGGGLTYAGGLYLLSSSARFGGFSGLTARPSNDGEVTFNAVTDAGDFAEFTGRLDAGRLVGGTDLKLTELRDSTGRVFPYKGAGDAEDLSLLPDRSGFVVAFEGNHRIIAYEAPFRPDGPQAPVDIPPEIETAPGNQGIEAVSVLPGGLVAVGAEDGRIWFCPKDASCAQVADGPPRSLSIPWGLSGFDRLSGSDLVAVYRTKALLGPWRAKIVHISVVDGKARMHDLAEFRNAPGNMEGIAAVPLPDGAGWRLYLISDNGFDMREPTVLLAFDWRT